MPERIALINMFIGLCTSDAGWPSTLHDLGYSVKAVNGHASTDAEGRADVVAASDRTNHVLAAYCLDEKVAGPEPSMAYKELKAQHPAEYAKDQGAGKTSYTICHIAAEAGHDEIGKRASLPRITFGKSAIRGSGDFGYQRINDVFENAIPLDGAYPPRNYYTLSQDNKSFLLDKVCAAIISISTRRGETPRLPLTDPDVARRVISGMYPAGEVDTARREFLRKKVAEIIDDATANYGLDPNMTTSKPRASTTRKVKGAFRRMSDDYKSQPRIDEM